MRLTMTVSLPRQPSSIGEARHILAVLLSLTTAEEQASDHLAVLLTEACANVVRHGDTETTIDLHIAIESGTCVLEIGNRGRVPNGGRLPTRPPDPAQTNGRGLALIAALSDSAQFVPTTSGYVLLRMTLRLQAHTDVRAADRSGS
jgi:serine/threonine-protein kinase RsbW